MATDPATYVGLPRLISPQRLAPYLTACGANSREAVRLYTWNVQVSSAFWGELHALEIVLRNAMNDQLVARFSRPDWWEHSTVSFTSAMSRQLDQAIEDADKVAGRHRRTRVAGDVIAALSLGFWSGLLGSGGRAQYETLYWQPTLVKAFPHYSGSRSDLGKSLNSIRLFRNRIAHHEPVFPRHLAADHDSVVKIASFIDNDAAAYIMSHTRVPDVLNARTQCVAQGTPSAF